MTEQEAREALLVYLKTQDHRYLSPKLLMPVTGWSPMQYPVVTAHDEHTGNLCFFACVVHPYEVAWAFNWIDRLADYCMKKMAPPGEEPLEYDTAVWIGEVVRP